MIGYPALDCLSDSVGADANSQCRYGVRCKYIHPARGGNFGGGGGGGGGRVPGSSSNAISLGGGGGGRSISGSNPGGAGKLKYQFK